jgi:hypothetical protein
VVELMRDPDDLVRPVDRKLHDILAHIADTTDDDNQRQQALDLVLTLALVKDRSEDEMRACTGAQAGCGDHVRLLARTSAVIPWTASNCG